MKREGNGGGPVVVARERKRSETRHGEKGNLHTTRGINRVKR